MFIIKVESHYDARIRSGLTFYDLLIYDISNKIETVKKECIIIMDIICARCGKHFSSIEAAREHKGHCKETPSDEIIHWVSHSKTKVSPEEWENIVSAINYPDLSLVEHSKDKRPIIKPTNSEDNKVDSEINSEKKSYQICPECKKHTLYFDSFSKHYKCDNKNCGITFLKASIEKYNQQESTKQNPYQEIEKDGRKSWFGNSITKSKFKRGNTKIINPFLISLLLIFALSVLGIIIALVTKSIIPFCLILGFSVIFTLEKWRYTTIINKWFSRLYRLILNLGILSLLGLLIWSGIKLFSQQFLSNPLSGSFIFLSELILFIWMWRVISRNSWRWPSMKLTIFSLIILFLIFAFAGVQPMKSYKDKAFSLFSSNIDNISDLMSENFSQNPVTTTAALTTNKELITQQSLGMISTPIITSQNTGIDRKTGIYNNFYLGLVKSPDGVISGNDCYGEFIVLINNKAAQNPTYSKLLDFLDSDNTDQYPYQYTISLLNSYYGTAESHIDLTVLKEIIDGTQQPKNPKVCSDFAERLHNNAEKAGIRCAYVSLDMVGYTDPNNLGIASSAGHALCAFETSDKGLVYIDCTGDSDGYGPANHDTIVDVLSIGEQYNPRYIFPSGGWYIPTGMMGEVTGIYITWDGNWNN